MKQMIRKLFCWISINCLFNCPKLQIKSNLKSENNTNNVVTLSLKYYFYWAQVPRRVFVTKRPVFLFDSEFSSVIHCVTESINVNVPIQTQHWIWNKSLLVLKTTNNELRIRLVYYPFKNKNHLSLIYN